MSESMKPTFSQADAISMKEVLKRDSGLYSAVDEDGKTVVIMRQKGVGFSIHRESKPGWSEILIYNEDGDLEGVSYERDTK